MNCLFCGAALTASPNCPNCARPVTEYKKILYTANAYYNDGLAKARLNSLSEAAESLKRCLRYNKNLIEARNLLGLVYFEMGEGMKALVEWSISLNLQPYDNLAGEYLAECQNDPVVMDQIRQTSKKFNMAIQYINSDNQDLAVIQLKKVVEIEPKMVAAYQLLALLYMKRHEFVKARKVLAIADKIDRNNPQTQLYVRSLAEYSRGRTTRKERISGLESNQDRVQTKSGYDTIVEPRTFLDNGWVFTVLNVAVGLLLGLAVMIFLILPGRVQNVKDEYHKKEQALYAQMAEAETAEPTTEPSASEAPVETGQPDGTAEPGGTPDPNASPSPTTAPELEVQVFGDQDELEAAIGYTCEYYYERAQLQYSYGEYAEAKLCAQKMLVLSEAGDQDYLNGLYYLGRSYQMLNENANAVVVYKKMVELYPDEGDSQWQIVDAKKYIQQLQ